MKKYCSQCGSVLQEGERFCSECGAKAEQTSQQTAKAHPSTPQRICPNCGSALRPQSRFCKKCGMQMVQGQSSMPSHAPVPPNTQGTVFTQNNPESAKKYVDYTPLRIVLGVICVGLIIVGLLFAPGKICERTTETNVPSQQSQDSTQNSSQTSESESSQEDTTETDEKSKFIDDYKKINEAYNAGEYSKSEEDKQIKEESE